MFYYDGSHKVFLTPHPGMVVLHEVPVQQVLSEARRAELKSLADDELFDGMLYLDRIHLSKDEITELEAKGCLLPVICTGGVVAVLTRQILFSAPFRPDLLARKLSLPVELVLVPDKPEYTTKVFVPKSGLWRDSLRAIQFIHEAKLAKVTVSPNFIRTGIRLTS
ncbi:hypothetical protein KBA73_04885 [Patescibacteria group bacterium]|nr:hypothetical protein [Patescibacteria group bacterium]